MQAIYRIRPARRHHAEHFHKHFNLNVLGLLLVSQEAARSFNAKRRQHRQQFRPAFSTIAPPNWRSTPQPKASVDAITNVLAKGLAPRKIRVNAVNPHDRNRRCRQRRFPSKARCANGSSR